MRKHSILSISVLRGLLNNGVIKKPPRMIAGGFFKDLYIEFGLLPNVKIPGCLDVKALRQNHAVDGVNYTI